MYWVSQSKDFRQFLTNYLFGLMISPTPLEKPAHIFLKTYFSFEVRLQKRNTPLACILRLGLRHCSCLSEIGARVSAMLQLNHYVLRMNSHTTSFTPTPTLTRTHSVPGHPHLSAQGYDSSCSTILFPAIVFWSCFHLPNFINQFRPEIKTKNFIL